MVVLKETTDPQNIFIIPREATTELNFTVTDDITGKELVSSGQADFYGDFISIPLVVENLEQNRFYTFRINSNATNNNIYKDKIFVTNQEINQVNNKTYSINKDQYVDVKSNNDYIVI
tara:strand:- start:2915 stop:3268 length:354 start_codon:yes stop_codon:yes gene_type:complete